MTARRLSHRPNDGPYLARRSKRQPPLDESVTSHRRSHGLHIAPDIYCRSARVQTCLQ